MFIIHKETEEGENGCANDAVSGRVDEVMMRDMRGNLWILMPC